jgi:multiple RNA-binding domain-containing protein 1
LSKTKRGNNALAKEKDAKIGDAQLDQFLKVMQPRSTKGPSWANEPQASPIVETKTDGDDEVEREGKEDGISDLDWMKKHMTNDIERLDGEEENVFMQSDIEVEFLWSIHRSPRLMPPHILQDENDKSKSEDSQQSPKDPTKETILQTSRLFLRNLAFSCTDNDLLELFKPFGEVSQVSDLTFLLMICMDFFLPFSVSV